MCVHVCLRVFQDTQREEGDGINRKDQYSIRNKKTCVCPVWVVHYSHVSL